MKLASNMTDEELERALAAVNTELDEFEREKADPDYEGHGGSPGEGLYERHEELTLERRRRKRAARAATTR